MGLFDLFRRKEQAEPPSMGGMAARTAITAISGAPPGFEEYPGMRASTVPTPPGTPPVPAAFPMFPQTQSMSPPSLRGQGFSPSAELMEAQGNIPQSPTVQTDDLGRRISHLEDKMELMNEKLDLILRELRNIYESSVGRRI